MDLSFSFGYYYYFWSLNSNYLGVESFLSAGLIKEKLIYGYLVLVYYGFEGRLRIFIYGLTAGLNGLLSFILELNPKFGLGIFISGVLVVRVGR